MICTDEQLIEKIKQMIITFEDEVVEFKEARTSYSFKDIGKYFSASIASFSNVFIGFFRMQKTQRFLRSRFR